MKGGDGRVDDDHPQPVEVHDVVDRCRTRSVQQFAPHRAAVVVIADHPKQRCAHPGGDRLHRGPQPDVGVRVAGIGEIAGHQDGARSHTAGLHGGQDVAQPALGSLAVGVVVGEEVRVAELDQRVTWPWVLRKAWLAGIFHA